MKGKLGLLLCVSVCVLVDGVKVNYITPCHMSNEKCLKSSAQRAVPHIAAGSKALGLESLDPLRIPKVSADQSGLKMDFMNTVVKGLRHCHVLSLKQHGSKMNMDIKCSVTLIGDYNIGGKLLILKVEGNGKYKIKIRDIVVKVEYEFGEKIRGHEKFWTLNSWKYSSEVMTGAVFQFQNLFNGNKELSDTIHEFANSNWKDIFQEVAPPIVKAIVSKIIGEVATFFDKVPMAELTLD